MPSKTSPRAGTPTVLYCGDHALDDAARYFAGALRSAGISFDYLPSDAPLSARAAAKPYALYVLSDYPSRFLGRTNARWIAERVRGGAGLLMIGGWGSFTGVDGFYGRTALAEVLPVRCLPRDDRQQGAAAYRLAPGRHAELLAGSGTAAAFDLTAAPTIAGYNKTVLKPGAQEILRVETLAFRYGSGSGRGSGKKGRPSSRSRVVASDPLLAVHKFGRGRAVAYCSDLAPHWSGGLVDWGKRRVTLQAAPGAAAQVGSEFVRFALSLIRLALP